MYKVLTSLWSKSTILTSICRSPVEDDSWVYVTDPVVPSSTENQNAMTSSWIASPPLMKAEETSLAVHQLNPIENLLIEHASMSVYEDIASKTSHRRQREIFRHEKLDEQTEDDDDEDDEDDDAAASMALQHPNMNSAQTRALTDSSNSLNMALESSTLTLAAQQRHLYRLQQRRKRASKLVTNNSTDESKQVLRKLIDRPRCNYPRSTKLNVPLRPKQ